MKFGIFYEHQIRPSLDDTTEHTLISNALDQVELADSLGIQYVWEVEHHFLEEYSHFLRAGGVSSPRPASEPRTCASVTASCSPRHSSNIRRAVRNGWGCSTSCRTDGFEFGSGESSSEAELGGFGLDPLKKREAWLEGLVTTLRCMVETPFTGIDGQFVTIAAAQRRAQAGPEPHPPLWVACSRRDHDPARGREGHRCADVRVHRPGRGATGSPSTSRRCRQVRAGRIRGQPQVACVSPMMLNHDEDEAIRRGVEGANFFGYSLVHFYVFGKHRPGGHRRVGRVRSNGARRRAFDPRRSPEQCARSASARRVAAGDTTGLRGAIGTPDQVREYLRRYEEAGVDQVIFVMQAGRNAHEHIMESIDLFGREVLPEFIERDGAAVAAKAKRMEPIVEARDGSQGGDHDATRHRRLLVPGDPAPVGRGHPRREVEQWLEKFADDRAAGKDDMSSAAGLIK